MMNVDAARESELLDAIASLTPEIRAVREETERARHLPSNLVQRLARAGLFKLFAPRSLGGSEIDPLSVARIVEAASAADPSVGWCVMVANQFSWFTGYLTPSVAAEVLGDSDVAIAGQLKVSGEAVAVAGGYRVSGRWPFMSGSDHATWFVPATELVEGGARLMFMPRADVEVLDTWHVTGLRGTASHDVVAKDVFVPNERTVPWRVTDPVVQGPLYDPYVVGTLFFITQAAQAFGVARSAIDEFVKMSGATRWKHSASLQEQPNVHIDVARAEARLAAARAYAYEAAGAVWKELSEKREPTMHQRAHLRLAITFGIESAVEVVDAMFRSAGSRAIYASSPLDQYFRDIHAAAAHVQATPAHYEATGPVLLGLEPPPTAVW